MHSNMRQPRGPYVSSPLLITYIEDRVWGKTQGPGRHTFEVGGPREIYIWPP